MKTNDSSYRRNVRREVDREMTMVTWAGLVAAALLVGGFAIWEVASNPPYAPAGQVATEHNMPPSTTGPGGPR